VEKRGRSIAITLKTLTRVTGSITMLLGRQKFETCPGWGANTSFYECELAVLLTGLIRLSDRR
jgi:hypothetical protein